MSTDTLEKTILYRTLRALPSVPDPMQEVKEFAAIADFKFEKVGSFAPAIEPTDKIYDYAARVGEKAAAWGPEERKYIDRRKLYGPALAEIVRQDLEIMEAEAERPRFSLKPGELREVVKTDRSGRPHIEFYSDEATGVKPWMDQFKPQVVKYVSGGSAGISGAPPSGYIFNKSQTIPELVALQKHAEYLDLTEYKVIKAYADAGKVPPESVLASLRK